MTADETERLMLAQIRRGDAGAWDQLIALFEGRLLAFVDSRLRNRAASEDVVQEAFMGFLISLPNYDETTPLESWLFSITAHKLTDYLRREGRRPTIALFVPDSSAGTAEPAVSARRASSMMQSAERRTGEQNVIGDCLRGLVLSWMQNGEFERLQCVELLFVLGWSNKAVAERLDIAEQAVANHKHFVVSKMKEAAAKHHLHNFDPTNFSVG